MGNPFSTTSVNSYNANPPADDGSQVAANLVAWSTIKSKLPDPIKTAFDTSETATNTAFSKIIGGGGFTTTAVNYTVLAADQGKFVKCTASGKVITTPDATSVGSPFVFAVVNTSAGDITLTGNNPGVQQTVDGTTSVTIPAGCGAFLNTDGTNWFTAGQNFNLDQIPPQGRLTLVSNTPIMATDQAAKTSVFYTPFIGNLCPVPNGTKFIVKTFSELTLTLNGTNYVANNIYDVFIALDPADGSTVIIGTGPTWQTSTSGSGTRGTGAGTTELFRLNGIFTNNNAITLRNNTTTYSVALKCATYVGSILIDGTNGQVSCYFGYGQNRKFGVWNFFNRVPIVLQCGDGTASWTYASATWRQSNAAAGNTISAFTGTTEEPIRCDFMQNIACSSSTGQIGIGVNSTTAPSGFTSTQPVTAAARAYHTVVPGLGVNSINLLESATSGTVTYSGTNANMLMAVTYLG